MTDDPQALLAELNRVKAIFQLRAISAAIGLPLTTRNNEPASIAKGQEDGVSGHFGGDS